MEHNKKENITLTLHQEKVFNSLVDFIKSPKDKEILLIGHAGTGKTTLVTKFINMVVEKKLCSKIVIAAPTHKAVNIAKSKLFASNPNSKLSANINIMTVHRLLNYQNFIDTNGEVYYAKSKADTNWTIYDLVVVDECSMLSNQIILDIDNEINKKSNSKIKVIYVGDSAQLPPVNQSESIIFNKKIKKLELNKIVRTESNNIMELSNGHRKWIASSNDKDMPSLCDYTDDKIILHSEEKVVDWLNKFVNLIKSNNLADSDNNIILTWTNKKCDKYNSYVREKLFNKKNLEKYEVGEILIFNDFHRITKIVESESKENEEIISFYTSEQIKLHTIKQGVLNFEKMKNLKNTEIPENISNLFVNCISSVNKLLTKTTLKVYYLQVQKLSELKTNSSLLYDIVTIHSDSEQTYSKLKDFFEVTMCELKNSCYKIIEKLTVDIMIKAEYLNVVDKKINRIWKEWSANVIDRFAQLNYGYAITVHKSQGSTFKNVFIDIMDVFSNCNQTERVKCLYTAITRSSHSLELLV